MSGHSKWAQIKRQKGAEDAKKSKVFGKLGSLIATESKKCGGDTNAPGLRMLIDKAKKENMPKDTIERAVKKGAGGETDAMESLTYEGYGPGGCALIIEAFTGNRNKAAQEIKHLLTRNGGSLAAQGAASWAFTKSEEEGWVPNSTIPLSDEDGALLSTIIDDLENNSEVQDVYTNAD
jgi:YebC/PmpR family DNA-binding regulatory protein